MKKVAFVSDVHANLEALQAVLAKLGDMSIYCLGDIVGYGASPNEVIALLRSRGVTSVLGNHDYAVVTGNTSDFNARAAISAKWTARVISAESEEYLKSLPQELSFDVEGSRIYLTHGSPLDHLWEYVNPGTHSELFDFYLKRLSARVIALGHTHVPYVWKGEDGTVLNPGSVGQPRDGDSRSSYAVATFENGEVEVQEKRMSYDIREAAEKIREAGLPEEHASRLFVGM